MNERGNNKTSAKERERDGQTEAEVFDRDLQERGGGSAQKGLGGSHGADVTTRSHVYDVRIRQIRPVLNTFKCVSDVVLHVQLTLNVRSVGKNSRSKIGRGGLEIDVTTDTLK